MKRPRMSVVEKIARQVSKKYGVPMPIVSRTKAGENGYMGIEIRSELPSYEGGNEMSAKIEDYFRDKLDTEVICENQEFCVYFVYIP